MKTLLWVPLHSVLMVSAMAGPESLPQTRPLDWEEADLSSRLMEGAHRFVERKIAENQATGSRNQP